jgi:hypothetical protein
MSGAILPFPGSPPTDFLERKIAELALDSRNIEFDHPHFQQRMKERSLVMRQVLECIRQGSIIGQPKKDQWGDWRVKLQRYVAGRRVQVVVAYKGDRLAVVTAI